MSFLFDKLLLSSVSAVLGTALTLFVLLKTGAAQRLAIDVPNQRSLHIQPIPRVGGVGITAVCVPLIVIAAPTLWPLALLSALLGALSLVDDRWGLSARYRFVCHLASAAALLALQPPPMWWLAPLLALALGWMLNLYNFMDGADGLAGGMALIGFSAYSLAATPAHAEIAAAAGIVAGAAAGFLFFNFPPAKVFLGDVGSVPLGFLAGGVGYWGWVAGAWSPLLPVIAFSPFIADATVTLLKRFARGERVWEAHREHYYQRMIRMAGAHRPVVLQWYALMLVGLMLAQVSLFLSVWQGCILLAGWGLILVLLGRAIDIRWRLFLAAAPN
ncbi:glycosyl transferase [Ralstonia sp. ASV6]|uniref:glycosyl transferase n=1 Tax=Ralstonia sp. ASV6 TaxID=2795124 RepID=UPI0018ED199C|nr:glycosyl transferase [Ralstonia sp. ASV6]